MENRPGGPLASRPLHFIWILDASYSMSDDGKIQALNTAVREAIPHMRQVAADNPNAEVLMRVVTFSNGARWLVPTPTPVADFSWADIRTESETQMGAAFQLVAEQLQIPPMPDRALPPVLVLMSDGEATDDWRKGLEALMSEKWGQKAVRLAIAIGVRADHEPLQAFIGNSEMKPLQANNPEALQRYIRWASTAVVKNASDPHAQDPNAIGGQNVPIPAPPDAGEVNAPDVW